MGVMSDWLWRDGGFLSVLNCDRSFVVAAVFKDDGGSRSGSQSLRGWVEIGLLGGYHAGSVGPTVVLPRTGQVRRAASSGSFHAQVVLTAASDLSHKRVPHDDADSGQVRSDGTLRRSSQA